MTQWHQPAANRPFGCLGCSRLNNRIGVKLGDDYKGRRKAVPGPPRPWRLPVVGPAKARVLFVWPQPSYHAHDVFAPFRGDMATISKAIANTDLPANDAAHTAAVRCAGEEKIPDDAVRACSAWLSRDIERFDPDIIVPIGAVSLRALFGPGYSVDAANGQPFRRVICGRKRTVVACVNPAAAYHNPAAAGQVQAAIAAVADLYHKRVVAAKGLGKYKRLSLREAAEALDAITDGMVAIDTETSGLDPFHTKRPVLRVLRSAGAAERATKFLGRKVEAAEGKFAGDYKVEDTGEYGKPTIAIVSWSTKPGTGCYVLRDHMDAPEASEADRQRFDRALAALLTRKTVRKVFHNAIHEATWFIAQIGVSPKNFRDTLVMEYLRDENDSRDLTSLALRETGMGAWAREVDAVAKKIGYDYRYLPAEIAGPYAGADADATLRAYARGAKRIPKKQAALFRRFFPRLIEALARMHVSRAKADPVAAKLYARYTKAKAAAALTSLKEMPGVRRLVRKLRLAAGDDTVEFNPNSVVKHVRPLLYEILKMPVRYTTKPKRGSSTPKAPSTAALALKEMVRLDKCETASRLIAFKKFDKQHGSFGLRLVEQSKIFDGYVCGHFRPTGTVTGRLASNDPNLQNMPKPARRVFVSRFGAEGCLVQSDFSQIELRVTASLAQDDEMLRVYRDGKDIHATTMRAIFDLDDAAFARIEKENPERFSEMRTGAKRTNFGVVYDTQAVGLMNALRKDGVVVSEEQAQTFIDRFYGLYDDISPWKAEVLARARKVGYTESPLNRRRHLPGLMSAEEWERAEAERQGPNSVVQGTASDLMTTAIIGLTRALKVRRMRTVLVLTVHDSLLADVPLDEVTAYVRLARDYMEHVPHHADKVWGRKDWSWLRCPIVADFEIGHDWRNMVKIKDKEAPDVKALLAEAAAKQAESDKAMRDEIAQLEAAQ